MADHRCYLCGFAGDLRPYGRDMQMVCFPCAMKPENRAEREYYTCRTHAEKIR